MPCSSSLYDISKCVFYLNLTLNPNPNPNSNPNPRPIPNINPYPKFPEPILLQESSGNISLR